MAVGERERGDVGEGERGDEGEVSVRGGEEEWGREEGRGKGERNWKERMIEGRGRRREGEGECGEGRRGWRRERGVDGRMGEGGRGRGFGRRLFVHLSVFSATSVRRVEEQNEEVEEWRLQAIGSLLFLLLLFFFLVLANNTIPSLFYEWISVGISAAAVFVMSTD